MKLELNHLTPYYDHGLWFQYNHNAKTKTDMLIGMSDHPRIEAIGSRCIMGIDTTKRLDQIKPLLNPLSDLSKKSLIDALWFEVIATDSDSFDKGDFYEMCELGLVNLLPFMVVQKLFEYHIDVFGLIPQGLAIKKS